MRSEGLGRCDRLRRPRDFHRVAREGRRLVARDFVLLIAPIPETCPAGRQGPGRLGITVSRRVGRAVVRNRLKRGIREWFRRHRDRLESDVDVVVIARRSAASLSGGEVSRELGRLLHARERRHRARDGGERDATC